MRINLPGLLLTGAIALLQLPFVAVRADPVADVDKIETEAPAQGSSAPGERKPTTESTSESPGEPFVPSESISADSAISFPVDI